MTEVSQKEIDEILEKSNEVVSLFAWVAILASIILLFSLLILISVWLLVIV